MKVLNKKNLFAIILTMFVVCFTTVAFASGEGAEAVSNYYATFWALVPPLVAIALALITKEVYSSLFVGILAGGLLASNFNVVKTVDSVVQNGLIEAVAGTAGVFIFLVFLGAVVALLNKAGGSRAFGEWASKHVKTKVGASLATFAKST